MLSTLATVFALASAALSAPAPQLGIEVPAAGPPGFNMCVGGFLKAFDAY